MIKFQFEKRHTQRLGEILKPIIPVTIIGPKRSLNIFMLLDSGADLSLIPSSVGETIGLELDIENRSEVQGIGEGSVPYILNKVKLKIENIEISSRCGFSELVLCLLEGVLGNGKLIAARPFATET